MISTHVERRPTNWRYSFETLDMVETLKEALGVRSGVVAVEQAVRYFRQVVDEEGEVLTVDSRQVDGKLANWRFSERIRAIIDDLKDRLGLGSKQAVVESAIHTFHRRVTTSKDGAIPMMMDN